jgi:hypothetical protein
MLMKWMQSSIVNTFITYYCLHFTYTLCIWLSLTTLRTEGSRASISLVVMEACTGKSAAALLLVMDMNRFKNCVLVSRLVAAVNILNISYLTTIRETLEQSAAVQE